MELWWNGKTTTTSTLMDIAFTFSFYLQIAFNKGTKRAGESICAVCSENFPYHLVESLDCMLQAKRRESKREREREKRENSLEFVVLSPVKLLRGANVNAV